MRQHKGNDKYSSLSAPADACYLRAAIGRDRIEAHDKALSTYAKELIMDAFPDAVLYSPNLPELTSGISSFNPFADQSDLTTLNLFRDRLRDEYGFIVRSTDFEITQGAGEVHALRISTHLFHNTDDVEGLVDAMADLFGDMT